jgi:dienelactone hydrolase
VRRAAPLGLAVALLAAACAPALRDLKPTLATSDTGTIWFKSAPALVVSGDLVFPSGPGPFPAIVMMHGCSGLPHQAIEGWRPLLREWGYATFVVDSFGPRGPRQVCTTGAIRSTERIPDAYGALRILATHPRIDRRRIALMGFSHGGLTAVTSATGWAQETYTRPGDATFRAFFAFYPYCNARSNQPLALAGPLRIHTGELDDWTPAVPCVALGREARALGFDVQVEVYPGAPHGFDSIGTPHRYWPEYVNAAACFPRVETVMGPVINEAELQACRRRGATSGWYPPAMEAARRLVRVQLAELLAR